MKYLIIGLVLINISVLALDQSEKAILVSSLVAKNMQQGSWEGINDQAALDICLVNKEWNSLLTPSIAEHRKNKREKLYDWIGSLDQDMAKQYRLCPAYNTSDQNLHGCCKYKCKVPWREIHNTPVLKLCEGTFETEYDSSAAARTDLINKVFGYHLFVGSAAYIFPQFFLIGPSGNTCYNFMITRNAQDNVLALKRIKSAIQADGSLRVNDIQIIDDVHYQKPSEGLASCCELFCTVDDDAKHCSMLLCEQCPKLNKIGFKMLVGNVTSKSYGYDNEISAKHCWGVSTEGFLDSVGAEYTVQVDALQKNYYLTYNYEHATKQITCYEHVVAVDVNDPNEDKVISLNLANGSGGSELHNYLGTWPFFQAKSFGSTISPPAVRLVHYYQQHPAWPREIPTRFLSHVWDILQAKETVSYEDAERYYLSKCDIKKLARLAQIFELCGDDLPNHPFDWDERFSELMSNSEKATVYCDHTGCLSYQALDGDEEFFLGPDLPDNGLGICRLWAQAIAPRKRMPNEFEAMQFLRKNRFMALLVTADHYLHFYKQLAWSYARCTWDNGTLAAYWSFDCDRDRAMRVRLYDLKAQDKNYLIGHYVVPGRIARTRSNKITDIDYTPGSEPLFCINGKWVFE